MNHRLADHGAGADQHIENPGREPRLCINFREQGSGGRGEFRWFEDHTVARNQRGSGFPEGNCPWKIPWGDQADDTEGSANRIGESVASFRRQRFAVHAKALARIKFQERNTFHHFALGFFENLSLLARERARDFIGALARDLGSPPKHAPALRSRCFAPALGRSLSAFDGALYVVAGRCWKFGDDIIGISGIQIAYPTRRFGMKPLSIDIGASLHNRTSE